MSFYFTPFTIRVMTSDFPRSIKIGNETSLISPLVERLLDEGESAGAVAAEDRCKILLSLVEALTNAMIHGNLEVSSDLRELDNNEYHSTINLRRRMSPYCARKVAIEYKFTRDCALFQITDEGPGFDLSLLSDPAEQENLHRVSGRGIAIMRAFLDEVTFNEKGNRVTLIKYANCFDEADEEYLETHVAVQQREFETSQLTWVRRTGR
jgi:anti-sigma regulatory factor (Ser/Thr protein kinase)